MNTIMESFVHRDVVLGILPLDSANNFARSLGIPVALEKSWISIYGRSMSRRQGLKFCAGFLLGRHLTYPESRRFQVESTYVETIPRKHVILGGEKVARTPIQISVNPVTVKIMATESFRDHDDTLVEMRDSNNNFYGWLFEIG